MEISGTVQGEPTLIENCCVFSLEGKDGLYLILSTDKQAVKDHIFIEKGQKVQVTGSILEQNSFKGVFVTERAKIEIRKNIKKVKPYRKYESLLYNRNLKPE